MRIPRFGNRLLRLGLFAILTSGGSWFYSLPAETAPRFASPAERPPMFVLQVGIGKYLHTPTWAALRGSVNDVMEMRKVLVSDRYSVPPANIVTLTNEQGTKAKIFEAFRAHLIAKAREHFERTKRKDAVVMFEFSGHGSQVPDTDGDEKDDHLDETLVTYDSDDAPGKNFDITDDEIFALTSELRRYTDNIVYVFDSCHSGSGTRDAEDVRRLPERKTVPVPVAGVGAALTRSGSLKPEDDAGTGVLPPGDDYIVITAARSNQLASERNCFEECGQTKTPVAYGNLTFYLTDELKQARSDTSYRELMENVARRVAAERPTQTPQLEGDGARFVFGALGSTEDNFTRIVEPEIKKPNGDRTIKIRTGAMQGVTPGTIVSFYDKGVARFDGVERVAGGSVVSVTPTESVVRLIDPKRELTIADKAVVVSADLGSLRLKVNLDVDAAKLSTEEKNVIASVRSGLTELKAPEIEARGVDVIAGPAAASGRWDVAVLKDKFSNVASKSGGRLACKTKTPDDEVIYLAGKDYVPLYGFCVESAFNDIAAQNAAANRIEDALIHISRLRSIAALSNRLSALKGKVVVRVIRLSGSYECKDSKFTASEMKTLLPDPKSGNYLFKPGEVFRFEVINNSASDLYLTLLDMPPDGSVKIMSPRDRADEKAGVVVPRGGKRILMADLCRLDSDGNFLETGAFLKSPLFGIERFKLIASTQATTREDFAYLAMPALSRTGNSSLAGKTDWTTVETILQINDTGN